ncbi:MAG: ParB/RepB/Spo0J family partition protein [Rhodobacteraceae bacterium]|nr:ParB/RepB/Spo0J family partition protein [Paracoccaceae bacterium]
MADKKPERRGLGRGLSALMADVAPADPQRNEETRDETGERQIPIDRIQPNLNQPRKDFEEGQLNDLANSIREKGVIQPLILRESAEQEGIYEIVAGERRWRAAQVARLHEVPALVRDYDDTETLEIAIIENIQRAELNAMEEATGYRQLMDRFGHTQEKIAEALGKSRSHIANLLRLLNLPDTVQDFVRDGTLSAGHARALVTAKDPIALAKSVVGKGLSVRETESLVKTEGTRRGTPAPRADVEKDADTAALEGDLSAALAMKVTIDHQAGGQSGRLTVGYKTLDELDRLCNLLSAVK